MHKSRLGTVETAWQVMRAPSGQRFCVLEPQRRELEAHANRWV